MKRPLTDAGILAIWNDCRPEGEADYEAWYRGEHLRERVGLPGFILGRRYVSTTDASPRYFTYYETETPAVMQSSTYLERGENPTPLTRQIMTDVFINMNRTVCRRDRIDGDMRGTFAVTARANPDASRQLSDAWSSLSTLDGRLRAELWLSSETANAQASVEERIRGHDQKIGGCFLAEFTDAATADEAITAIRQTLNSGGTLPFEIAGYRLHCSLHQRDIV